MMCVNTSFGQIEGVTKDGVQRFIGIPYAKAPLNNLRFRAPQLVEPWGEKLSATRYAKDPIQNNLMLGPEYYSEDCLYLNIWVPDFVELKTPVMVWIPGGAYATGGSGALSPESPAVYDCALMAKDTGCIIVSISYRLNVFGFLNLSGYSDRFDDHLGMKDIIMALRWVNEAIESFGGDRNNVTIFGESAGAGAISALLLIDEAAPYFHKAIMQSNCFGSFYTVEEEEEICEQYLKYAGLDRSRAEELLSLTHKQLLDAGKALDGYIMDNFVGRCTFCPVVDGDFLRGFPTLASYESLKKPVLIGSNRHEGNFLVVTCKWNNEDARLLAPKLLRRLAPERREEVLASYPDMPSEQALGELLTDVMYAFPKIRFAERLSRYETEVYVYRFDYYTPTMDMMKLKACHVAEMLPLFEITAEPYRQLYAGSEDTVHKIGKRMRSYWGAFAHTGNPNIDGFVEWRPYSEKQRNTMVIDEIDILVEDVEVNIRNRYDGLERILI